MPMAKLTTDEILQLSRLANLILKKKEIETLKSQLSDILNYFEELKNLKTDNVVPTSQTTGLSGIIREDKVENSRILTNEEATSGTRSLRGGTFVVSQVIDKS
jgi:aspartyl-tRNA(Asn)/glutamyl-tRNA(Gln) amidotransferase subunit C